jgi:phage recombination protein Bet
VAVSSTDLTTLASLGERPIIDQTDARRLDLIRKTVAQNCTDAEIASFLELAARYGLDPFAKEVWCAKGGGKDGGSGKLLIMVGRDGLRKIAHRAGLLVDGDVVHENDEFTVQRTEDGMRAVRHIYGKPSERGNIVGAWCEVYTYGTRREQHGFFFANISEYRPANASSYSPWSKQTSTMIRAAAERQALRQATPLSGLLVEGEDESARASATTDTQATEAVEDLFVKAGQDAIEAAPDAGETAEVVGRSVPEDIKAEVVPLTLEQKREMILREIEGEEGQSEPDDERLGSLAAELDAINEAIDAGIDPGQETML